MNHEHLVYNLDLEKGSLWLRTTPHEFALQQPFYCSEAGIFYGKKHFSTSRKYKDSYILFYTFEGCGEIKQNDIAITLPKGYACLLNCRIPQSYQTKDDVWRHYWLHIDGDGVKAMADLFLEDGHIQAIAIQSPSFKEGFDQIIKALNQSEASCILHTSYYIHDILHQLYIKKSNELAQSDITNRTYIEKTLQYMQEAYFKDIHMDELLAIAHMSKSYYMRLFQQYTKTTPYQYILSLRITKAKEYLELTNLTIAEIAQKVGFADHATFSVRFHSLVKESPTAYRRHALKK